MGLSPCVGRGRDAGGLFFGKTGGREEWWGGDAGEALRSTATISSFRPMPSCGQDVLADLLWPFCGRIRRRMKGLAVLREVIWASRLFVRRFSDESFVAGGFLNWRVTRSSL